MAQKLVIVDAYCTRVAGSGCARCAACCPHGAITLPEDPCAPQVDFDACTGCGICFGVCDAFASTRITMADLHARLRRIAMQGRRAFITCNENVFPGLTPDSNVVVLPCISMVPPELWTLLLAENIRLSVACDFKYCEDCARGGELGGELFPRSIEIAQEHTGGQVKFSYRIPEKQTILQEYTQDDDPTDRRAAFTGLAADLGEIASGKRRLRNSEVLSDYYAKKERQRAVARLNLSQDSPFSDFAPAGQKRRTLFPKQRMLLEAVERRHDIAENIDVVASGTEPALCTGSGACADACPTGARSLDAGKAVVDPLYCVGCGACVDACAQGACYLEEATAEVYLERIEQLGAQDKKHRHRDKR